MSLRMAFLDAVHPSIQALVRERAPAGWTVTFSAARDEWARRAAVADAEIAFIIGTGVDAALIEAAPRLRFVQKLGAGVDNVDLERCRSRGVAVARLEAGNAVPVAEHTVLLMLAALRKLPYFDRQTNGGAWLREEGRSAQFHLAGKRIGLIGFGAIGREVAKRLKGFDVEVVYVDPRPAPATVERELQVTRTELEDLLATADVISLHLPLEPQTRNLLDAQRIGLLKPGATLVNCARGGLVDEDALAAALARGGLRAAALDTFAREPPVASPLLGRADVIATPHLAGATYDNFALVFERGVRNVERFLAGKPLPPNEVVVGM